MGGGMVEGSPHGGGVVEGGGERGGVRVAAVGLAVVGDVVDRECARVGIRPAPAQVGLREASSLAFCQFGLCLGFGAGLVLGLPWGDFGVGGDGGGAVVPVHGGSAGPAQDGVWRGWGRPELDEVAVEDRVVLGAGSVSGGVHAGCAVADSEGNAGGQGQRVGLVGHEAHELERCAGAGERRLDDLLPLLVEGWRSVVVFDGQAHPSRVQAGEHPEAFGHPSAAESVDLPGEGVLGVVVDVPGGGVLDHHLAVADEDVALEHRLHDPNVSRAWPAGMRDSQRAG